MIAPCDLNRPAPAPPRAARLVRLRLGHLAIAEAGNPAPTRL